VRTDGSTNINNCQCNSGWMGMNTACARCIAGKYKVAPGAGACQDCTPNSISLMTSTASIQCTCNARFTGPNGGPCTVCPTYSCPVQGSLDPSTCACNAGFPAFGALDTSSLTIFVLLPKNTPHPTFSTQSQRTFTPLGSSTMPMYNENGKYVSFDSSQFISTPDRNYNLKLITNGGFTAIVSVRTD